jgi:hypothetical protein
VLAAASFQNLPRRPASSQKRHTTGLCPLTFAPAQPPSPSPSRSGSPISPRVVSTWVAKPPNRPIEMAASVLATAKCSPSTPEVRTNIAGSMTGEASQNAMTGPSGTPMASSAAISGMTPQEQNGDSAPNAAASTIMVTGRPVKALAIRLSAPAALAAAASAIETTR